MSFNAIPDCEALHKAMSGPGTDELALISILCQRTWKQRNEIEKMYKQMYGKDLAEEVKNETSGKYEKDFHKVLQRLLMTPAELAAFEVNIAMNRKDGPDETCLVEIVCTKSNEELREIEKTYKLKYLNDMSKAISTGDAGNSDFRRLLVSLLACSRPADADPDPAIVAADAKALFEAGQNRFGTDEMKFNTILCSRSYRHLRAVFDKYLAEYKKDISDVIESEFSGDAEKALLGVVQAIRNRPAFFATRLYKTMAGAGTHDEWLLRLIVSRYDFDMAEIKAEYQKQYGKSLADAVADDTSGDFKKALLALIGK